MDFVTAFVGLPSSGKSSIINSLCFKRLLQSGVCRTTTEYKKLDIDIFDDFNNKFKVIDLPGISDSEENEMKFNDLTYTHIIDANLIVWVSDVHKSFITTHEVNEYNRLKDSIKKLQEDSGTIYKIVIMLSKCDKRIDYTKKPTIKLTRINDLEEITDLEEDTNINDLVNKVKEKFPNEDIILFNAYGRSYHNEKSSNIFKTFIKTMSGIPTNENTTFDISKYMKNYVEEQKTSYELKFESVYKNFINLDGSNCFQYAQMIINNELNKEHLESILNKLNASKLIQLWKKLDKQFIITHLIKICSADYDTNYANYLYIIFVVEQLNLVTITQQYNIILMRIIDYELSMLNSTDLTMLNFQGLNKCGSIINTIMNTFNKLEHYNRVIVINNILFNNKYKLSIIHTQLIFAEFDDIFCYDFKNLFNQFILSKFTKDNFNRIYSVLIHLIKKKSTYELKTSTDINKYLDFLQTISLDDYYILLNKLQILHNCHRIICDYQKLINDIITNTGINYHRLMHNPESKKIIIDIWKQIHNNIVFTYDGDYEIYFWKKFKIINKFELLYVDTICDYNKLRLIYIDTLSNSDTKTFDDINETIVNETIVNETNIDNNLIKIATKNNKTDINELVCFLNKIFKFIGNIIYDISKFIFKYSIVKFSAIISELLFGYFYYFLFGVYIFIIFITFCYYFRVKYNNQINYSNWLYLANNVILTVLAPGLIIISNEDKIFYFIGIVIDKCIKLIY